MNMDFLPELDFNWRAEFDQEDYTILNPSIDAISKGKSISAILKFFTDLGGMYLQDEAEDKSMTALNAYTELFQGTGKRVHLVDNFHSNTLSYQKNQSRVERFHYYNERFKAEFVVRGDDVYLYNKIGSHKPDVRIDEDLNVKDAKVEIDSENFFTWCKCYFDVENTEGGEDENYQQDAVYINQALYDEYGDIEGPALYQGNIRHESTMLEYAREQQEKSIQVSHSVNLIDLQRQGYGEFIFGIGDTVRLSLSSIDTTVDIRVVEINETFVENAHGEWERTELRLTLGNASKVQSYKQSRNDALQDLDDWINGRREPPMSVVPAAIKRAADIVMGDTDSVMEYRKDRLIGWHSKNEGNNVQLNVSGLVLHQNGVPKTAITHEGITADAIVTGSMLANHISGGELIALNGNSHFNLNNGNLDFYSAASIRFNSEMGGVRRIRNGTSSIVSFPTSRDYDYPMVGIGVVNQTGGININHESFRGIRMHGADVPHPNDLINDIWDFIAPGGYTEGSMRIHLTADRKFFAPQFSGNQPYDLGTPSNGWDMLYLNERIEAPGVISIRNKHDSAQGYRFPTTYEGGSRMVFRGLNAGSWFSNPRYYDLGEDNGRWSNIYLYYQPNVSSDARLKEDIHHNDLGLNFINDLETKIFKLINSNPALDVEPSQYGLLAQQVIKTLEKHGVNSDETNLISQSEEGYYGLQYTQLITPLIKAVQELSKEVEALKNAG